METVVGTVAALHRFPVKSMLGERVRSIVIGDRGVEGDRAYALVDEETSKIVSVKRPARWGRMFELAATTRDDGRVVVTFPDGRSLAIDDDALPGRLSAFFGRAVGIATSATEGATFDEAWVRELKGGADPYFGLPSRIEEEGEELIEGGQFMSPAGNLFNLGSVHLVTTGTTRRLSELAPDTRFDPARFRPNVVVDTTEVGFVESGWAGRSLRIGSACLAVTMTVPRCVMTTLEQGGVPADRGVLQAITRHNAVDPLSTGVRYPCAGVYAEVVEHGRIAVGDPVVLTGGA